MTRPIKTVFVCLLFAMTACEARTSSEEGNTSAGSKSAGQTQQSTRLPADSSALDRAAVDATATAKIYEAGTDYLELNPPVPTLDKDRVEVTEIFWYGCSHCYVFEPELHQWVEQQTADVLFQRSPAMWDKGGVMERHARMYYTAKALGVLDAVHQKIFDAMNLKKKKFQSEAEIADFFVEQGVSKDDFSRTFNSFGVTSAVRQAESRQRSYQIQGTPELIVNGKYRVTGRLAGSHEEMLNVTNFLVEKERKARDSDR